MDYYIIGQRIRKIRKAHGISQEELAEKIGISTTHMSHIETGNTKLSLPVFVALSTALDVCADELLNDVSPSNRSASINEIIQILDSCTSKQVKILSDLVRAAKISMDKYL